MDQQMFRETLLELDERPCVYEKAILSGLCRCSQAQRFNLAEREGVHCQRDEAQFTCQRLMELLRQRARFALRIGQDQEVLPHNKALRLQIGGLHGLYAAIHEEIVPLVIADIYGLIHQALDEFDDLENLPFQLMIKEIAAYKGRDRKGKR